MNNYYMNCQNPKKSFIMETYIWQKSGLRAMIKLLCRFLTSTRVIVCCCLIISIFAQPTATASGDIELDSSELSSNTVKNINYEIKPNVTVFEDYEIETNVTDSPSPVAVIAIHGGKIEQGTTELAYALSSRNHYNYYSYLGVKSKGNATLHIASDQFAEPTALKMVVESETTLSIHGCAGSEEFTYIGGLDTKLGNKIKESLTKYGFTVLDAPKRLAGLSPNNIVNRNRSGSGVQLEISRGLRTQFLSSNNDSLKSYVLAISEAVNSIQ
jgi:phage replication-related protein YjqB (UPF0714/DUF867 family)